MEIVLKKTVDDDEFDYFYDIVVSATGEELSEEALLVLFYSLPMELQILAFRWGMNDTEFGDDTFRYLKENGVSKG